MNWNPDSFREYFSELSKQLKHQAFWKIVLFGVLLLERQWPVYEKLSVGRTWGVAKEVRQVLDRLWKGVSSGMRLDDKYLLMLEGKNSVAIYLGRKISSINEKVLKDIAREKRDWVL